MGRRRRFSLASAAVFIGLLLPVALRPQQAPRIPLRCLPQPAKKPSIGLAIDSVQLEGADLPSGVTQDQFTVLLEQSAVSGGSGWLDRVWDAAWDEWRDQGYSQAVVNIRTVEDRVEGGVRHVGLRIRVDPGPQYRVGEVRMLDVNPSGRLAFSDQKLRDLIPLRPGELVDVQKVSQGVKAIEQLYASHGYIELQVTPDFQIQGQQDLISLFVMLDQGQQYRVGNIVTLGFGASERATLISKIKSGDIFDWNVVRNFYSSNSWLMPPGASIADDIVHRNAKTHTVDLLLDFRACPKPAKAGSSDDSMGANSSAMLDESASRSQGK